MIFIDTGAFLARYLHRDQHHEEARTAWEELSRQRYRCFTSSFVVDETLTLLGRRASYPFAAERGRRILASKVVEILRPGEDDEQQALTLFEKLADQRISFTDCVSFALMRSHRLQIAFTFDHHFEPAGFLRWPGPRGSLSWVHEGGEVPPEPAP